MWRLVFTKDAQMDAKKIAAAKLKPKVERLISVLRQDPFGTPPAFEKLVGDIHGCCSRRINRQHRLVYQVLETDRVIKVLRMWTHYE